MKKLLTFLLFFFSLCVVEGQTISAGNDTTLLYPTNTVVLHGSFTPKSGYRLASKYWTKSHGGTVSYINNSSTFSPTINNLPKGVTIFTLIVTENKAGQARSSIVLKSSVTITVDTSSSCVYRTPIKYTLTATAANEIYHPNLSFALPGDTLVIPNSATWDVIEITNLRGTRCQPIVIVPASSGVSIVGRFSMTHLDSFVTINGYISPSKPYGISVRGVIGCTESSHMDFSGFTSKNPSGVAYFFKENPDSTNPLSLYGNYTMLDIRIHDSKIDSTAGEGMYIGSTDIQCQDHAPLCPTDMDSVQIYGMVLSNLGWDGIQVSNAQDGCLIHDNSITNFGIANVGTQQCALIEGGNCSGSVYNNTITNGTGNGIEVFGYGTINVYNNTVSGAGADGSSNGQQTFFSNQYNLTNYPSHNNQTININNNHFTSSQKISVIRLQNDGGNSSNCNVTNNNICAINVVGAPVICDPPSSTITPNNISCP